MRKTYLKLCVLALGVLGAAPMVSHAVVLHRFTTGDSNPSPDDGYVASFVSVSVDPNVTAPGDGTQLNAGNVGLNRFWNSEWAGFTLSSPNLLAIDNATEFNTGYLAWTVAAVPGQVLNLTSLDFGSARGGTSETRGFEIYAEVNGGTFAFGDTPLLNVDNEPVSATRAAPAARSIDLTGAQYQGIDSITFRYYPTTFATGNSIDFNGMTLNGATVAVPEPASLSLLSLSVLALRRRRRA
jgi:hypothetical protein